MPDINDSVGNRAALSVVDLAVKPHHFPRIFTIIHTGMSVGQRRVRHVQRAFNGARGAGFPLLRGVDSVLAQVEKVFQSEACRQQRRFLAPA